MSGETTRAPWATGPSSSSSGPSARVSGPHISGAAPGAGASVTRAPWAAVDASMAGAGAGMGGGSNVTRAPWAQGLAMPGAAPLERIDFEQVAAQNPEYHASLGPGAKDAAKTNAQQPQPSASTPDAEAPASGKQYSAPTKVIKTPAYLPLWKQTSAYAELTGFILLLNERVRGVKVKMAGAPSKKYSVGPHVQVIIDWLHASKTLIASIPPIQQSMRYGNKAFRTWHEQRTSVQALQPMLEALLPPALVAEGAIDELIPYLQDAFGSWQRIDYGTGHELNFVLFLCALNKLGVFTSDDHIALVLEVFRSYILLMEELQSVYWLEPAGSKGAWGLDDYQFLIFLWGSSQLIGSTIQPAGMLQESVVEANADSYLFLLGIKFIHRMKSGPFHEHSAFLHQISQLQQWQKANSGLIKMYEEEVLNKHPIVQHILFGRILRFEKFKQGDVLGITHQIAQHQQQQQNAAKAKPPVPLFDAVGGDSSSSTSEQKD